MITLTLTDNEFRLIRGAVRCTYMNCCDDLDNQDQIGLENLAYKLNLCDNYYDEL